MRVVVSGGTGFVGKHLVSAMLDRGEDVTLLTRAETTTVAVDKRAKTARWSVDDATDPGHVAVAAADAIVNLAGAGVLDQRWTEARLRVIRESRIETTRALAKTATAARVFVSASAVGYYGMHMDDTELDESSPRGDDVLAQICADWESATGACSCRVAIARIGIVLGQGGALARIVPMFRRFVGGPIGSGKQWWSWVHIDDVVAALLFALDTPSLTGPFNVTAEAPATMNDVARMLGHVLGRPHAVRVPAFALRLALGDAADVLLTGQRVLPKRLLAAGFQFRFRDLEKAVRMIDMRV